MSSYDFVSVAPVSEGYRFFLQQAARVSMIPSSLNNVYRMNPRGPTSAQMKIPIRTPSPTLSLKVTQG